MYSGLTRREITVLTVLVLMIAIGLGARHFTSATRKHSPAIISSFDAAALPPDGTSATPVSSRRVNRPDPEDAVARKIVDINSATLEDLCTLKGIGPVRAADIIEYRQKNGPFRDPADLERVKGIGPATMSRLRGKICANPLPGNPGGKESPAHETAPVVSYMLPPASAASAPVIVNINTAGVEELMTLNGIGEKRARDIIEFRESRGAFASPEDIMKVSGIGEKTFQKNRARIRTR